MPDPSVVWTAFFPGRAMPPLTVFMTHGPGALANYCGPRARKAA